MKTTEPAKPDAAEAGLAVDVLQYRPASTLARFHASRAFVRAVMGPVGSGKSSAMCVELLQRALAQAPGPDNVRRTRMAVVRATYPELKTTTLKTWADWVPPQACVFRSTPPISCTLDWSLPDGTRAESEVLFLALERSADARKLLSLELTGAWVNEARELDKGVVDGLTGRVGRYPSKSRGGPSWSGVILDTNPPDQGHWYHQLAEGDAPDGWEFFRQPPALLEAGKGGWAVNPSAENLDNQPLGGAYWLRQAAGKSLGWVDVYLRGRYGCALDGTPVYPEYDETLHPAAGPLAPIPGQPLILGWDFGLTPACAAVQLDPRGRLLVLAEWVGQSVGIRNFVARVVKPDLESCYRDFRLESYGDPAGTARAQTDERTCLEELAAAGVFTSPARTNAFAARREAVAGFLSARPDDGPGLLLDPACSRLKAGFASGYRFANQAGGAPTGQPDKNRYSHIHDALQYAALAAEERCRASAPRPLRKGRRGRRAPADSTAGY